MGKTGSAGLTLITCLALVGSGCSSSGTGKAEPSGAPAVARAAEPLERAADALTAGSFRFAMTAAEGEYGGGADPATKALDTTLTVSSAGVGGTGGSLRVDVRRIDDAVYAKVGGLAIPGVDAATWYRVDTARVRTSGALGLAESGDPTGIRPLTAAVTTAQRAGDRGYTGTVDLTRVALWGPFTAAQLTGGGVASARAAPFEAEVDDRGRLVRMSVTIPGRAAPIAVRYRDLGVPVTIDRPAPAPELPAALYPMLGI